MDKLLIVDDMQQNIELMSAYITNSGFEVSSATNGTSAITKAKIIKPSLIILDLIMPEVSGYDICKKLKSDPETSNILILIVTALDSKETRTRAFELGADDFLSKPFDKGTLISKVKGLLRLRHLSDELDQQYAQLKEKNAQLDLQLKMARQVQQALIKEYKLSINDINLTSRYMPALDIGGDLYDVIHLSKNSICIFMSDVSGHGISAALLTSMIKMMFENTVAEYPKPDLLLEKMNEAFCSIFRNSGTDVYACAFYAYIDTNAKRISFSNAGHALPVFVDSSENTAEELVITGIPLGLMENTVYEFKTLNYEKNDLILFYTDGLSDSYYKNSPDDFLNQLKFLLLDMKTECSSDAILNSIIEHFYNSNEEAKYENDDVSLILCEM